MGTKTVSKEKLDLIIRRVKHYAKQYEFAIKNYKEDPDYAAIAIDRKEEFIKNLNELEKYTLPNEEIKKIIQNVINADKFFLKHRKNYYKYVKRSSMWLDEDKEKLEKIIKEFIKKYIK
ncbi:hypothetical protein [Marinitoga aeolica]|uniref:Uncharacterized protein n=1 Tax=Marinitoga aeolica TaxID=2809031 RepID=A0ABY8PRR9_9BACT|nr:hypothetical protein [Marinitoga aeolica]WGS65304.1 hypothetical protein JRV97_01750 [Marinitoga aeolica]